MQFLAQIKALGRSIMIDTKYPMNIQDGEYVVEIRPIEKDKTRRQVNYFWSLMRAIAMKLDGNTQDAERYYGQCLKMANIKVEGVWVKDEALDDLKKLIGHFIVTEKNNGFSLVVIYKGISQMNVKEMQALIDCAITYASRVGVPSKEWEMLINER